MVKTKFQNKLIQLAKQYVHKCSPFNKSLHATIICHGEFPIVYGVNQGYAHWETCLDYSLYSRHSEADAVRRFKRNNLIGKLEECDVYNVRVARDGSIKNSRPCQRCQNLLKKFSPRRVYYTNEEGDFVLF